MSGKGMIHVFIGAPAIAQPGYQDKCKDAAVMTRDFYEGHRLSLQGDNQPTCCPLPGAGHTWKETSSPSLCSVSGGGIAEQLPFSTKCSLLRASSTDGSSSHKPAANLHCDFLDLSVNEDSKADISCSDSATSTQSEFLSVLASSQVAAQSSNSETCQMKMRELERSSSPRFTELNDDPNGTASCKRKTTYMGTMYLPSASDQKSKKSKPFSTLVKHGSKETDNQKPQTTKKPLTLLKHCFAKNKEYNILAVVLQPCHVKEIWAKSGPNSGSSFPLATIVVLDTSGVRCKVLMWRTAAFWSLQLFPGDIIMLTHLAVCEDKWNKETFLQSTFNSRFLNLGNFSVLVSHEYENIVEYSVLEELLSYISTNHCYLRDLPSHPTQKLDQMQYVRLSQLQPEILVHSILKVVSISILKECTYNFKGLQQNKVILTVEEVKGQLGTLILWGTSVSWCDQIRLKRDYIWVFKYLFCKKSLVSGEIELHTTPWSSWECLFDDDNRAIDFRKRYYENLAHPKLWKQWTVTKSRYSYDIQINVSISELEFLVPDNQNIHVNKQSSLTKILNSLSSVVYTGCGKCRKELKIDSNHVYEQCFICLPFNQVRLFYSPVLMTVRREEDEIFVHVPSDVLEKMFLNISPNLLHKLVSGSSKVTYGAIVADVCHSLLADNGESYLLTVKNHFSLDENSLPLEQEFHVLSFLVKI